MAVTNNSPPGRQSFFDDDNLDIKFDWQKVEKPSLFEILKHNPLRKDTWTRTQANSQTTVQGYFLLYPRHLYQFKNNTSQQPELVLEIANSKMKVLPSNPGVFGFSLSKNGNTYEFTTKDENLMKAWVSELKAICVLATFHDDYKAIKMIGKGSFAKVYLVESKSTGKTFAVKAFTKEGIIMSNKANAKPSIINEIDIMRCADHENIIKLYEVFETEKSIYLVLELIEGKSMQEIIKRPTFRELYPEAKCVNLMRSLLDALAHLASRDIMHRDLKPDNILLDKGEKIKIVDFGLATFISIDDYIFKKCGTPGYIAPEVFKYDAKVPTTSYDDRCDVFSAGCLFFYMLFGSPFFDGAGASEILKMNRKFTVEFEALKTVNDEIKKTDSKISKEALDLLKQLLEFDQKNRPRAAEALTHPIFGAYTEGISKADSNDFYNKFCESPTFSPKLKNLNAEISKSNSNSATNKERYEQKDSLYLDVGQPVINGKVDTMTSGVNSHNNSLLLQGPSNTTGSNNSISRFAGSARKGGQNDLLRAAIFNNAGKGEMNQDDTSPTKISRTSSLGYKINLNDYKQNQGKSPENVDDDAETDVSNENTQVQGKFDKISPSPTDMHSIKMAALGKGGVNGNSPTHSPSKNNKYEESKSPY
mmetsp:Transcript_42367/g.49072  ORF Transcript_42367/g.49072 Transcript_42367/m.49072 type:complete len:647 (-) Transcript_42367:253-2193(-)|eukprot:CAMPEP_0176411196 /NCGR_PEP_ID=MMETSP0127-20121128/3475_1 /TAXON_ID=938130 /ORGANISM="Platyophrya macrostoma, Strain WH" /LENGTH=646 /DNA_ID=CAMNT_0017790771 /DNA_START=47 /DNA_END=1987 /DNA_ORIENTATION=-